MNSYLTKSYGTVLRDHPEVEEMALTCYTFKLTPGETVDISKIPKKQKVDNVTSIPVTETLPKSFRGHHVWANYITLPGSLGKCGDDWAASLCHCIADRFSIFSLGQINVYIHSDEILYCGNLVRPKFLQNVKSQAFLDLDNICVGYSIYDAAKYIYQNGISEASCLNEESIQKQGLASTLDEYKNIQQLKQDVPNCSKLLGPQLEHCIDKTSPRRIFRMLSLINVAPDEGYNTIKYEIYRYGPVTAGFLMYKDFLDEYDGTSIYMGPPPDSSPMGGHTIRILGWGRESKRNIDFWICANNWSTAWGEGGYFRIKMGIPECQLEQNVTAPIVNLSHLDYTYEPAEVLNVPNDWKTKNPPIVIRETLFTPYTTQLVRDGKLNGDLMPLIYKDFKIDADSFWAGDIDFYVKNYSDIGYQQIVAKIQSQSIKKRGLSVGIVMLTIGLGVLIGYLLIKYTTSNRYTTSNKYSSTSVGGYKFLPN